MFVYVVVVVYGMCMCLFVVIMLIVCCLYDFVLTVLCGALCLLMLLFTLLDVCVSSLRRGHANPLCIVPMLTDDPRRESSTRAFLWYVMFVDIVA